MKRRDFVKQTSLASSLMFVPSFIQAFDKVITAGRDFKRLVIIQLAGGNDGLNTIVPFRNDIYYSSRRRIALKQNDLISISDELAMNRYLMPLKRLFDQGHLSIINNVGYPNPDRSHFRSTDIWQSASDAHQYLQTGWVGRYLDAYGEHPYNAIEVNQKLSLALKGDKLNGIATNNPDLLYKTARDPFLKAVIDHNTDTHLNEHNLGYLYRTLIKAESSAKYIYETTKTTSSKQSYTGHEFGRQLKTTAEFINSGLDTRVYFTAQSGYDTHVKQMQSHARQLNILAKNLESFINDLKSGGTFKDTLIMVFSEFGRRVKQNAAEGTDHGAASNVFVIGENLKRPGIYNPLDDLQDLDEIGDIKYEIDFRSVYSTILKNWLKVDDERILNDRFKVIDII